MKTFLIIWLGQFVSRIGTALTRFALLIWLYQQTQSALSVALLGFFAFLPAILVSPFAGVWVDRLDRRKVLILADTAAGLTTLGLLILHSTGSLAVWHLYVLALLTGSFEAFQSPAYMAAVTVLVPKDQYGRAGGLRSLAEHGAQVLSPVLAGLLLLSSPLPWRWGRCSLCVFPCPPKTVRPATFGTNCVWASTTSGIAPACAG